MLTPMRQRPVFSTFSFIVLSQEVCSEPPWELLFVVDLAIVDMTPTSAQDRQRPWNNLSPDNGQTFNVAKTGHTPANVAERKTHEKRRSCQHLGSVMAKGVNNKNM